MNIIDSITFIINKINALSGILALLTLIYVWKKFNIYSKKYNSEKSKITFSVKKCSYRIENNSLKLFVKLSFTNTGNVGLINSFTTTINTDPQNIKTNISMNKVICFTAKPKNEDLFPRKIDKADIVDTEFVYGFEGEDIDSFVLLLERPHFGIVPADLTTIKKIEFINLPIIVMFSLKVPDGKIISYYDIHKEGTKESEIIDPKPSQFLTVDGETIFVHSMQ